MEKKKRESRRLVNSPSGGEWSAKLDDEVLNAVEREHEAIMQGVRELREGSEVSTVHLSEVKREQSRDASTYPNPQTPSPTTGPIQ